jgi:DNA-binding MarR family transcriptional regulator
MKKRSRSATSRGEGPSTYEILACTNTALRRAARRLGNLYDDALAPSGLKATQLGVLSEIQRWANPNGGQAPTLQDLAGKLSIQISALTHALRPLVRDGLIVLQPDEQDGRTKRAALTPGGETRLGEALEYWATVNQRVEAVLGPDSAATLRALADLVASDEFLATYSDSEAG